MLLLLEVWRNTSRINYAYATYHGRFGKTIGEQSSINCDQYDWTAWRGECILCFACTFRDVNTTDGILTWAKVTLIKKQEGMYKKKSFRCYLHCIKMNKSGEPAHPLYLKADLKPVPMGT